jgi:hypothetical protein
MADRDYDRDRWQNENNENRNRDWERNQGRSNYDRGASDRGNQDYGRGYNRGASYNRGGGYNRSGFGSDLDRSSFPLDYNRRSDQGWANDLNWDDEPSWSYSEYWWIVPGPYSGIGPQGYERSDERLCEEVCERMAQHGQLDASQIHVDIEKGEATLTGMVNTRREKRLAEDITESVYGVKDVHNQLRIQDQERFGATGQERSRPFEAGRQRHHRDQTYGQSTSGQNAGEQGYSSRDYRGQDYGNQDYGNREAGRPGMSAPGMGAPDMGTQDLSQRLNSQAPESSNSHDMDVQNTGSQNIGDQNTGARNTGDWNIEDRDFGDQNINDRDFEKRNTAGQDYGAQDMGRQTGSTGVSSTTGMSSSLNPGVYTYTANPAYDDVSSGQRSSQDLGRATNTSSQSTGAQGTGSQGTGAQTTRAQIRSADEVSSPDMNNSYRPSQAKSDVDRENYQSSEGPEVHIDHTHTDATLPSGNLHSRIHEDMPVVDRQGDPVGKVKEIRQNDFLVDRPMARDVYVPFSACQSFDKEVTLNVRASEVDQQNWKLSDLFGSQ